MTSKRGIQYAVEYQENRIVLTGRREAIEAEARKLINRFASSALPLRVMRSAPERIELAAG